MGKNNYIYKNKKLYYFSSEDFLLKEVKSSTFDSKDLFRLRNGIREWIENAKIEDFLLIYKDLKKDQREFLKLISDIVLDKYNAPLREGSKYSKNLFELDEHEGKFILRGKISGKNIKIIND